MKQYIPSIQCLDIPWKAVITTFDLRQAEDKFRKVRQSSEQMYAVRQKMRKILRLANQKRGLVDSACFILLGQSTLRLHEMNRTFRVHNSRFKHKNGYEMIKSLQNKDKKDRETEIAETIAYMTQCQDKMRALFFVNSLLHFIHPMMFSRLHKA